MARMKVNIYRPQFDWSGTLESADTPVSDLILVHSGPSGVLNIARYTRSPAAMASWIEQFGNRRVPESIDSLTKGGMGLVFVKVHTDGVSAPEEDWLCANARVINETRLG